MLSTAFQEADTKPVHQSVLVRNLLCTKQLISYAAHKKYFTSLDVLSRINHFVSIDFCGLFTFHCQNLIARCVGIARNNYGLNDR
jgi:hypothetical protein